MWTLLENDSFNILCVSTVVFLDTHHLQKNPKKPMFHHAQLTTAGKDFLIDNNCLYVNLRSIITI